MNVLLKKLLKTTKIKDADILGDSKLFQEKEVIQTAIPAINIALSGDIDGGLRPGLTSIAGNSKHFKSSYALMMAAAYMKKHPDAIILFYDSEFGSPEAYFSSFGIDVSRVLHIPITNIEEFKFDIMKKLDNNNEDGIKRGDKVFILVDSIGNLASVREADNAVNENSAMDMSRARELKGTWRMITPHLTLKNIPMVVIQHVYEEMKMFGKTIMSGGCLVPGTKIKMSNGTLKSVEDILVGENVITLDGDKPVTATWTPETLDDGEPECYKVTFDDGNSVICSETHKFLVGDSWVDAKDLSINDNVIVLL